MAAKSISFRIDEELKNEADEVLNEIGLNMTAALTMFLQQVVNKRSIPFIPEAADPFFSNANQERLEQRINEYKKGNYSEHDLFKVDK